MNNQVKMIRAEIERYVDSLERNSGMAGPFGDAQMALCDRLLSFIDSLQEEPVSEDLANAAIEYCGGHKGLDARVRAAFVVGANWQKEQIAARDKTLDYYTFENGEKRFAQYILEMISNGWHINAIKTACNDKIKED